MDRRGRFGRRLTDGPGNKSHASFAPDGARIAYAFQPPAPGGGDFRSPEPPPWEILSLGLEPGARPERLLHDARASFKQPAWSLDGRRLAYLSDEGSIGNFHLFTLDLESGARTQVTGEADRNDCHPAWAPDGRRLAFHAYEGLEADRANLYLIDPATGEVSRITDRPGISKHPSFASDRWVVFHRSEPGEDAALFAVDAKHGVEVRLTPPGMPAKQPNAVRDRKGRLRVAFAARRMPAGGDQPVFEVCAGSLEEG